MNNALADRLTRLPRAFDADRGAEARALATGALAPLAGLIEGAGGCSPYLSDLLRKERDWLESVVEAPEAGFDALVANVAAQQAEGVGPALRQAKRRGALLLGLADLGGAWPLEEVTGRLTRLADAATGAALRAGLAREVARGKLPGMTEDDIATGCGMVVLAMGKMGAGELNYSSDIDLICLFDETRFARDDFHEARASLIRATRTMAATLGDQTAEGYVFRTDLRLRPDPGVTPVCMAMAAAEDYYESLGRTWERAAYIKARAAAGDIAAGQRFLGVLTPFVWRKHLDFAAIRDAHDMRLRIREHKGLGGPITLPGHDMKLGRGGIREIEFFTQTRQLIAGGRDPSLRVRGTIPALERLRDAGWVPEDTVARLSDHYRAHREVEHRLQMIGDQQTQALPASEEGFARLAAFMGVELAALKADLTARLQEVEALTDAFFAPDAPARPAPEFGQAVTARWPGYPALRSDRAVAIFRRLRPEILTQLQAAAKPEEALAAFDGFLAGLPAGVQLFSLFEANPRLLRLMAEICATAPALALYLSRNAAVLDAVIGGSFFSDWPGAAALEADLGRRLAAQPDYESRLDAARVWAREWHFRIGVHHLQGLVDAAEAGRHYADLAEAVVAALFPVAVAEMTRKHGPAPGRGAIVLAMGSLGAGRLNAGSDLDLIVIYDTAGVEASDGPRPLAARAWYARLTQTLTTALTAPTAEGRLYEVDLRLRPSGRQGPVATAVQSFRSYQADEAWTWEHLALTRARPVAGEPGLAEEVERFRAELLAAKATGPTVRADVAEMRARLGEAKPGQGAWDAKFGPGRLMEVELAAQTAALLAGTPARGTRDQIEAAEAAGVLAGAEAEALRDADRLFWDLQAAARLLTGGTLSPDDLGAGARAFLLARTGEADMARLETRMTRTAAAAAAAFDRVLGG